MIGRGFEMLYAIYLPDSLNFTVNCSIAFHPLFFGHIIRKTQTIQAWSER